MHILILQNLIALFINFICCSSTHCCRPLIACHQRRAGLSTAGAYAPFILTVDWIG
nr:MAG TPA: hypothetical protein [Caudoviricetes sp.]